MQVDDERRFVMDVDTLSSLYKLFKSNCDNNILLISWFNVSMLKHSKSIFIGSGVNALDLGAFGFLTLFIYNLHSSVLISLGILLSNRFKFITFLLTQHTYRMVPV